MTYREGPPCPRCGSTATTADGACRACGHVWGEAHACAHCGAIAAVVVDRTRRASCVACGLPRIAAGWTMPEATAARLRDAVRAHTRARRISRASVAMAILCMPFGLIAERGAGFPGWLAVLILWGIAIGVAAFVRRSGRRRFAAAIAAAERQHADEANAERREEPRLRVDALASEDPPSSAPSDLEIEARAVQDRMSS